MPAYNSLRQSYPSARISWMVRPEFASVFDASPTPDRLILFDRKALGRWYKSPKAFGDLLGFFRKLRYDEYDLVIDLQGLFRTGLFTWFTGAKNRLGMSIAREGAPFFYTKAVPPSDQPLHLIDYYNEIVASTGAEKITTETDLRPDPRAVEHVTKLLESEQIPVDNFAVLVPSAAQDYKLWPIENYARLVDALKLNHGLHVVAVGSPSEKDKLEALKYKADSPVTNLAGRTSIPQLIALLSLAKLTVSNDTGPGHIAWALKTPTVFIFGPTNPSRVGPYGQNHAVAAIDPFDRGPEIESDNPEHEIHNVPLELVYQTIQETLQK